MKLFAITLAVIASACAVPYGPAVSSQYISLGHSGGWAHAAAPVHIHNGVPVDTPEVQHARAAHLAAHAAASHGHYAPAQAYHAVPQIHNGVPVDTPEVQHAKAVHFAAVAEAQSRDAHSGYGHDDGHYAPAHYASAHGAYHIPVIHNGVPVETPEVQHAKAAHFAAVAEASARSGYGAHGAYHGDDGHWDDGAHHQQW